MPARSCSQTSSGSAVSTRGSRGPVPTVPEGRSNTGWPCVGGGTGQEGLPQASQCGVVRGGHGFRWSHTAAPRPTETPGRPDPAASCARGQKGTLWPSSCAALMQGPSARAQLILTERLLWATPFEHELTYPDVRGWH